MKQKPRAKMDVRQRRLMGHDVFTLAMQRLGAYGKSYNAARKVLCEGSSLINATRLHQTSKQNVHLAIKRIEGAYADLGICPYCGSTIKDV